MQTSPCYGTATFTSPVGASVVIPGPSSCTCTVNTSNQAGNLTSTAATERHDKRIQPTSTCKHSRYKRWCRLPRPIATGPGGSTGYACGLVYAGGGSVLNGAVPSRKKSFRFWIDYQALSHPDSAKLLELALKAVGGMKTGGPPKLNPATGAKEKDGDMGYMHMEAWDLLHSVSAKCMLAAELLRPHQLLSIIPGFLAITRKTSLVRTLKAVLGEQQAWTIVPRSFKLPEEMQAWADHLKQLASSSDSTLWMLKNNKQRGTGLRLVTSLEALQAAYETTTRPDAPGVLLYRWYLAQEYIARPLLINGRKFGIRMWVLVPGVEPLRVYMHRNGLVLFSSHAYSTELHSVSAESSSGPRAKGFVAGMQHDTAPSQQVLLGHITNYAQNEDGDVWSLEQLGAHLGMPIMAKILADMRKAAAWTFASALARVQQVQANLCMPADSGFQLFGLDFLLDDTHTPWLLEVNATPSMKVEHSDRKIESLIYNQKWPVIWDMVRLLGINPDKFDPNLQHRTNAGGSSKDVAAQFFGELERKGGYVPLMHLFPRTVHGKQPSGCSPQEKTQDLPWSDLDVQLQGWCQDPLYRRNS